MANTQPVSGIDRGKGSTFSDAPNQATRAGKMGGEQSHGSSQASNPKPTSHRQGGGKIGNSADGGAKTAAVSQKGGSR